MRILIADDTPVLLSLLKRLLEGKGHEVVTSVDGVDALRKYENEGPFDFVVTDYQMPKKNGVVLIIDIRRTNPGQKCILVSGDPPTLSPSARKDAGEFPMLSKPYHNEQLISLLV